MPEAVAGTATELRGDPTVACAHAAIASMMRLGLKPSPENFQVWFAYHTGENPLLRRVVDTCLSNGRRLDGDAMRELHMRFCAPPAEALALREAADRLQDILRQVGALVGEARADAKRSGTPSRRCPASCRPRGRRR
jgi:diguanylate cyclase